MRLRQLTATPPGLVTATLIAAASGLASITLLATTPGQAQAHMGSVSYSTVVARADLVDYRLRFAAHLLPGLEARQPENPSRQEILAVEKLLDRWFEQQLLVEVPAGRCSPTVSDIIGPDLQADIEITVRYSCPGPSDSFSVDFHLFDDLLPGYRNMVSLKSLSGENRSWVFDRHNSRLSLGPSFSNSAGRGESAPGASGFWRFSLLGLEHILEGYDHLLFLLALLIPGGTLARLAGIVTSFTIAHSVTLALATLGAIVLPPVQVEIAIAASIVYVAAENIWRGPGGHRWLVTFMFGLLHGFGFAGVLKQAGIGNGAVLAPLLGFNLGVEAGQLAVIVVLLPLLALLSRHSRLPLRTALSWFALAAGSAWLLERIAALLA
ncbi:MAG: HupE/UreJ family protein [Proteobacteria bacterium]|nr:HupE/UreJ family protein [Pseudomonadota bacterium]